MIKSYTVFLEIIVHSNLSHSSYQLDPALWRSRIWLWKQCGWLWSSITGETMTTIKCAQLVRQPIIIQVNHHVHWVDLPPKSIKVHKSRDAIGYYRYWIFISYWLMWQTASNKSTMAFPCSDCSLFPVGRFSDLTITQWPTDLPQLDPWLRQSKQLHHQIGENPIVLILPWSIMSILR